MICAGAGEQDEDAVGARGAAAAGPNAAAAIPAATAKSRMATGSSTAVAGRPGPAGEIAERRGAAT